MSLKLVREQLCLIYGMRLFAGRAPEGGPHARVTFQQPGECREKRGHFNVATADIGIVHDFHRISL